MMRAIIQQLRSSRHKLMSQGARPAVLGWRVYGPNAKFPHKTYGDLGRAAPQMTEDVKALPIVPLLRGEDRQRRGQPDHRSGQSEGLIPGVYLGKFLIVRDLPTPAATTGRTLAEAVALMQGLVDTDADDATWESTLGFNIGSDDIVNLKAMGTVPDTYTASSGDRHGDLDEVLRHGTTPAPTDGEWGILAFGYGPWYAFTELKAATSAAASPRTSTIAHCSTSRLGLAATCSCPATASVRGRRSR
jgi:hypothetical protein